MQEIGKRTLGACGALWLAASPLAAQRADEVVEVVEVEVPVQVLVDGRPVRGLAREDFVLRAAGKRRAIVGFREVDLEALGAGRSPEALPLSARRHFVLLFDLAFATPANIARAREAAIRVLEEDFLPSDLVSLGTLSTSRGLQIILGFTPDHQQVRRALEPMRLTLLREAVGDPLGLAITTGADDPAATEVVTARGAEGVDLSVLERQAADAELAAGYDLLIRSFEELAELLRPVEGAKHVIYLSAGASSRILFGLGVQSEAERDQIVAENEAAMLGNYAGATLEGRFGSTSVLVDFEKMLKEFVRSGASIQAIDIAGLRAEAAGLASADDTLFFMADTTGGHHIRNHNDLDAAMNKILDRTTVSYVMTFQAPPRRRAGQYEQIGVRLAKRLRGARVFHRPGYHSPVPYGELSPVARRAEAARRLLAPEGRNEIGIAVVVEPAGGEATDARGPTAYAIAVEIDAASVRAAGSSTGSSAVEVYAYVFAADGRIVAALDQHLPPPTFGEGVLEASFRVGLDAGRYEVRVLARESDSGASATHVVALEVP